MTRNARLVLTAFLLAFVAGSPLSAASLTEMSVKMAMGAVHVSSDAPCQGCTGSDGGDAAACDIDCVTPSLGTLSSSAAALAPERPENGFPPAAAGAGRTGPPDPHPPRPFVLT